MGTPREVQSRGVMKAVGRMVVFWVSAQGEARGGNSRRRLLRQQPRQGAIEA